MVLTTGPRARTLNPVEGRRLDPVRPADDRRARRPDQPAGPRCPLCGPPRSALHRARNRRDRRAVGAGRAARLRRRRVTRAGSQSSTRSSAQRRSYPERRDRRARRSRTRRRAAAQRRRQRMTMRPAPQRPLTDVVAGRRRRGSERKWRDAVRLRRALGRLAGRCLDDRAGLHHRLGPGSPRRSGDRGVRRPRAHLGLHEAQGRHCAEARAERDLDRRDDPARAKMFGNLMVASSPRTPSSATACGRLSPPRPAPPTSASTRRSKRRAATERLPSSHSSPGSTRRRRLRGSATRTATFAGQPSETRRRSSPRRRAARPGRPRDRGRPRRPPRTVKSQRAWNRIAGFRRHPGQRLRWSGLPGRGQRRLPASGRGAARDRSHRLPPDLRSPRPRSSSTPR